MWWYDGNIMFSKHELENAQMVFPHNFCELRFPSLKMVVC